MSQAVKTKPFEGSILAEVSKVKDQLAVQFNYDVVAMLRDAQKREQAHGRRLVDLSKPQRSPATKKVVHL